MKHKTIKRRAKVIFALAVFIGLRAMSQAVPPGAAALGYTNCVINDTPTTAEIAPGTLGNYNWFRGLWNITAPSPTNYSTVSNTLALNFTGSSIDLMGNAIDTAWANTNTGALPLLSGSNGFYVEFDIQLSDNNPDHWACVWLEPVELENNTAQNYYPGDGPGFFRWMEFDVQESGWDSGLLGTVHYWTGIYPNTSTIANANNFDPTPVDMSQKHTFGGSYDPVHQTVAWWVDGVFQMSAGAPAVPTIATVQHFFLILSAYSHGQNKPYTMYVSGVRAYVPVRPAPPTNFHVISSL